MVSVNELSSRSSALVAPLQIYKGRSRDSSNDSKDTNTDSTCSSSQTGSSTYHAQMTPPATPNGSQEALDQQLEAPQPVFHNFLRAFYPFHPAYTASDSTVTLPLNEGDVILVHSIHTNGWADGTLLLSGARGWLPTNYCEAYDPESMRSLLKALLNFWDLLRSGMSSDNEVFGNQEFMRGIIAGVRLLLERSNCLTRESPPIKHNEGLRRTRKALLSDLSSLVKTAKRLQEITAPDSSSDPDYINDLVDEMVLKAFKIVTRGVRFLDVLDDHIRSQHTMTTVMPTVIEESYIPPTPPADTTSFGHSATISDASSRRASYISLGSGSSASHLPEEQTKRHSYKRISASYVPPQRSSRPVSLIVKRQSVSHRLSTAGPYLASQRLNLVSEKLSSNHDTLLSYLGSLIGRLHLQSQLPGELLLTIRQSISAGRGLLTIVEAVCAHDMQSEETLHQPRDIMYHCINQLILAARECVRPSAQEDDRMMLPEESMRLKDAATDCVVAAGECVAKTKFVIERIGDFELEAASQGLGIDISAFGSSSSPQKTATQPTEQTPPEPSARPPPPPLVIPYNEKPLPTVPSELSRAVSAAKESDAPLAKTSEPSRVPSLTILPPTSTQTSPFTAREDYSPSDSSPVQESEFNNSTRSDSIAVSTSASSSTYLSSMRDSESSLISQTSTRATTPDVVKYAPSHQSSFSDLSMSGSQATLAEDLDDGESQMLEKTFAHELLHNKEGQIAGGSLPALVERMTTHDSTPDAMFVSTFYLTFRLFVSPVMLAEALVDRFDYVAESPHIAGPVRLRVYNVFKGWLESHWRNLSDMEALTVIENFAKGKLSNVLPGAGRRLLDLAYKVTSTENPLVPRLVSSMGKTSTSIAQYISPETPMPPPIMSKSQTSALRNWKMGGSSPSILEFDPLELARQLTIKEMNIFTSIMPEELLASEWMKKQGSNAVNVRAMSTIATDLSNLVADTILQYDDAKKRATVIKHWIKIANSCVELNNYDSLMAIICSLNSSIISRLKKTWPLVSQKRKDTLKGLQEIVDPSKNYSVLRARLQNHVPPCLPFVGTYLTDLTFVDVGNPATKQLPGPNGEEGITVINFDKHTRTAKIIGELQRFQIPYRLTEVPELQEWLQTQIVRVRCTSDSNNVERYYRKSLLLEPRVVLASRTSPVYQQGGFATQGPLPKEKEKFDLFSWTHSKDKAEKVAVIAPASVPLPI